MTNTAKATKTAEAATACDCSKYNAQISEQHTEQNLADGTYDFFETGCTATTRNLFAPGHDAKLKSFLIEHGAQDHQITYGITVMTAEDAAKQYTFGYMIVAGIAKAKAKISAKAERDAARAAKKAAKGKPAERKLAESAGIVAPTHDGNAARQEREAKALSLAEIGKAEDAAYREAEAQKVAEREQSADWDDAPKVAEVTTPVILEDEGAMNAHAQDARVAAGLVKAKVGRWTYEGYVNEDGTFTYAAKLGGTKTVAAGKFVVQD